MADTDSARKVEVTEGFLVEVLLNSAKAHFHVFNAGVIGGRVTMRANTREDAVRDLEDFISATGFRNVTRDAFTVESHSEAATPDYSMAGFKATPRTFFTAAIPVEKLVSVAGFRYL